jgi:hypothetical protein
MGAPMSSTDHEPPPEPDAARGAPDRPDDEIPARPAGHGAGHRDARADPVGRLAAQLHQNAVDSLPEGALAEKLAEAGRAGRPLRVKLGIDPTAPDIHLGHAVVLRKLRELQDAGQLVVLIVGDYTARVGDPSGRSALRPMLSTQEIAANAATFREQSLRILDPDPARLEVRFNSEWLDMPMAELLRLVGTTTVAQLLERDDFAQRYSAGTPVSMLELLYPLLQGYDSVATSSAPTASLPRRSSRCRCSSASKGAGRCPSRWATTSASPSRPRRSTARR